MSNMNNHRYLQQLVTSILVIFIGIQTLYSSQNKIESTLQQLIEKNKKSGIEGIKKFSKQRNIKLSHDNKITVVLELGQDKSINYELLKFYGIEIEKKYRNLFKVKIPVDKMEAAAETFPEIKFIRLPHKPHPLVISEGVNLTGADIYQNDGYRGQGIKIAIIDGGFQNLSNAQANNELPSNVTTQDYSGGGIESITNHGTAVAEVVYDMAPDAELYLLKIEDGIDLGNAKDDCKQWGIDIINHSMGWFNTGPGDGTGPICSIADDARDNGIIWVNAAGNSATKHWEGVFVDTNSDNWHDFTQNDNSNTIYASDGQIISITLRWNDVWVRPDQDYDLYLYNDSGQEVASSRNSQRGIPVGPPPVESINYSVTLSTNYHIRIHKYDATETHSLELFSLYQNFEHIVSSSSITEPSDSGKVIAVGAIYENNWTNGPQEPQSSQGPTNDGRIKPDLAGPDGVENFSYSRFYGTSASAPHIAGAAALILCRNSTYNASLVEQKLQNDAVDIGDSGKDNIYGYGKLAVKLNLPQANNPLCEGQTNPVNLTEFSPQFSWTFTDTDPSDGQTAHQILVADSLYHLSMDIGDMWDSGKIISTNNSVKYSGQPLLPTTYYWKIRVWDEFSSTGTYCTEQSFNILDSSAPAAIGDLVGVPDPIHHSVRLTWSATGDDDIDGYINGKWRIDYSTDSSRQFQLNNYQIEITTTCLPLSIHSYLVTGLLGDTTYYFRIWTCDEVQNWSDISNSAESYVTQNYPPNAPTDLLCNGQSNPAGITDYTPDLSWVFSDPNSGDTQSAYQIIVSSIQADINNNIGNIWDTGKVNSSINTITYAGEILQYGTTYYWKVSTWDNQNSSGSYSQAGMFTMADIDGIEVIGPNGGETWGPPGVQETITWISFGLVGNVDIDLSTDGGTNWTNLISNTENDGSEVITVPDSPSTTCRIKVVDVSGAPSDISDSNFTIAFIEEPLITITSPNGGETWVPGTQETITWISSAIAGNVDIKLSTNDVTGPWITLVSDTPNDGTETITVGNWGATQPIACILPPPGLDFDFGEVPLGESSTETFDMANCATHNTTARIQVTETDGDPTDISDNNFTIASSGILTGTISSDKKWIIVEPTSFSLEPGESLTVTITADNSILNQPEGEYTGTVTITSNVGNVNVEVTLVATCVLAKPNPYNPAKGNLTFFGDGIVPGDTIIRIYTLSGELVAVIPTKVGIHIIDSHFHGNDISWDGTNKEGKPVISGIYIYTYESPEEKGVGKFTVVR